MNKSNYTQIPNELIRDSKVSAASKALYCLLSSYKPCFISYSRIMRELGIRSKTTVKKLIDILDEEGWLDVFPGGLNQPNRYKVYWSNKCTETGPESVPTSVQNMDSKKTNINTKKIDKDSEWNRQILRD